MRASGRTTTWKGLGFIPGTMAESMKACTKMIKSMDSESILGLMGVLMKAPGTKESSME